MTGKERVESLELKLLRSLISRMTLTIKEENYYQNLEKGYLGERYLDEWLEPLREKNWLILKDLLLEVNHTIFQIDTLLIGSEKIYFLEVKNYEGDFYIDSDKWYTTARTEIKNPMLQIKRSETLLRQLLQEFGYHSPIESNIIFVNPQFYLYQAPLNQPFIFPTQINRFVKKISEAKNTKLKDRQYKLAEYLVSVQLSDSPYKRLPQYNYVELQKGTPCASCSSINTHLLGKEVVCYECGNQEKVSKAILRSVEEYSMLFPDRRITTNAIYEWCKIVESKKTIRKVLLRNYELVRKGRSSFYLKV